MNIDRLLNDFPRIRPQLPPVYQDIYEQEYKDNRSGQNPVQNLSQRVESWMHRQVAGQASNGSILEIGAGTLNHMPYEKETSYDIIEPFTLLYEDSPHRERVRTAYTDICDVPDTLCYQRIISVAVLEHLEELPLTLAISACLLEPGGAFQAGIPSEGGFLWGLGWRTTTGLSYRVRTGLSYKTCMQHEHINNAPEIIALVKHFFKRVELRYFPLPHHHLSLYVYLHATEPEVNNCKLYLQKRGIVMDALE